MGNMNTPKRGARHRGIFVERTNCGRTIICTAGAEHTNQVSAFSQRAGKCREGLYVSAADRIIEGGRKEWGLGHPGDGMGNRLGGCKVGSWKVGGGKAGKAGAAGKGGKGGKGGESEVRGCGVCRTAAPEKWRESAAEGDS